MTTKHATLDAFDAARAAFYTAFDGAVADRTTARVTYHSALDAALGAALDAYRAALDEAAELNA